MKTIRIILIILIALTGFSSANQAKAQPGFRADISFNTFYDELSPYGQWMDLPRYGKVWRYQESGFRPYSSNGQWGYTDMGWSWESGYDWGWAPFHYGRWELDDYYGWIWIPGYDYAPAWVSWSQADDYYGWAPLGFGLDINISIGRIPSNRWMYASRRYITQPHIDRYCLPYERNAYYAPRQRAIGNMAQNSNTRYFSGPDRRDVERYTHDRVQPRQGDYARNDNGRSYGQGDRRNDERQGRNNNSGGAYPGNRDRGNITPSNDNPRNTPGRPSPQEDRRSISRADIGNQNNNGINNDLRQSREQMIRQHEQSQAQERQQTGEQENRQRQQRSQQIEERRIQRPPQRVERNNNDSRPSISSPRPRESNGGQTRDNNSGRERLERSRRN